jgi:hypothetical protein
VFSLPPPTAPLSPPVTAALVSKVVIDLTTEEKSLPDKIPTTVLDPIINLHIKHCPGIGIDIPIKKSAHSSYPFALHDHYGDPWNYSVTDGHLALHSRQCMKKVLAGQDQCLPCQHLTKNSRLEGIMRRMEEGIHEYSNLVYHPIGSLIEIIRRKTAEVRNLKLRVMSDARKLANKAKVIDEYKQWVIAVGSRQVERVDRLVRVNLARRGGMRNLLNLYERAAQGLYKPRTYTEEDHLRGLLLWRLGGARLAGLGNRAMSLPSLSTLQRNTILPSLIVSPSKPTLKEVKENVTNIFAPIESLLTEEKSIVHQVLMFDELKVEERPRYDDKTNHILGICREHGKSLEFASEKEVQVLLESVKKKEIHLAVDVCCLSYPPAVLFSRRDF